MKKSTININENKLIQCISKLQALFPKERKPNAYGKPTYSYKGNVTDVKNRLIHFLQEYKKSDGSTYSLEEIYEATVRYTNQYKEDKTYMKLLPYFIYKKGEDSQLANELENPTEEYYSNSNLELI